MTANEAVNEITSEVKWYVGVYPQSTASSILKSIREETIGVKNLKRFLHNFDYREIEDSNWVKIKTKVENPNLKFS